MGLKFYVGEIQQQGNEASRMNNQANQAISSLQSSISQFLSAPLSGKAYDSAKSYFGTVYTPLCRSAILTGEALESAHKRLLSEYQGMVSSIDTDEDQIQSQIQRFEQLKRELERQMHVAKTMRPDLEHRYMNACDVISKKREQLEKFHAYNARSASIFAEYEACQQEFNNGLAQVKDCKAWNSASGTFDIGRLNMTWASPINARWQQREKMKQEVKNREMKQTIASLNGYTIICSTLGTKKTWYLMKNGKIVSPNAHPNLYNQLEKCKNYLGKDQYRVEEVKVMRNEMPLSPAFGGILGNIGKIGKGIDIIRKGAGTIKIGQSVLDKINNVPTINAIDETAELDKSCEEGKPAKKHKVFDSEKRNLDKEGEPNSSADLLNDDGSVKQRRYYGPDGLPIEDIDYNHPDDGTHEFPHRHKWDWNKKIPRQKGEW
ncbi:hypothetical protein JZO73_08160 [Enterococcus plantarum]|nr:T7SS effector LXG polymorphic toxin [Enterococcus plantarum]MBO0467510.1 hypothetical protein [Enterococcus plantarum]